MCLLSPYPSMSCEIGEGRLYYWTLVPVPANDLTLMDLFNAHFIAGNPLPSIFQKADRVVMGNLLAEKRGEIAVQKSLQLKALKQPFSPRNLLWPC